MYFNLLSGSVVQTKAEKSIQLDVLRERVARSKHDLIGMSKARYWTFIIDITYIYKFVVFTTLYEMEMILAVVALNYKLFWVFELDIFLANFVFGINDFYDSGKIQKPDNSNVVARERYIT